jgi:hypothetical protein
MLLSPFLFTFFLEPSLLWISLGSRGHVPAFALAKISDNSLTEVYPGHGFEDDICIATGSTKNLKIHLRKSSQFSEYTWLGKSVANHAHYRVPATPPQKRTNKMFIENRLSALVTVDTNITPTPLPTIPPTITYKVLGV